MVTQKTRTRQNTKTRSSSKATKKSKATASKGARRPAPKKAATPSTAKEKSPAKTPPKTVVRVESPRFAAPNVCLGMTAAEVKEIAGSPECIVFTSDQHVEWQFGATGNDTSGAPTVYVTIVTFEMGRAAQITERFGEPKHA